MKHQDTSRKTQCTPVYIGNSRKTRDEVFNDSSSREIAYSFHIPDRTASWGDSESDRFKRGLFVPRIRSWYRVGVPFVGQPVEISGFVVNENRPFCKWDSMTRQKSRTSPPRCRFFHRGPRYPRRRAYADESARDAIDLSSPFDFLSVAQSTYKSLQCFYSGFILCQSFYNSLFNCPN